MRRPRYLALLAEKKDARAQLDARIERGLHPKVGLERAQTKYCLGLVVIIVSFT